MSDELYPIVILEDRYGGTYSGGGWLAIAEADKIHNGAYRAVRCMESGPSGDDTEATAFWADPPDWIAVGPTPDEARDELCQGLAPTSDSKRTPRLPTCDKK